MSFPSEPSNSAPFRQGPGKEGHGEAPSSEVSEGHVHEPRDRTKFSKGKSPDIEQTFVQLLVSHQASLNAFVLALLPGSPDADDVVQDVNALIWKKRGDFEIGTNFKAWMLSVARFKVMSLWRDQKRRKVWAMPEETLIRIADDASQFLEAGMDYREDALRECIRQLPEKDRGLILSRYMQGNSLHEMAGEIGRKAENLKGTMHRIRLALRSCVNSKINLWKATT